MSLDIEDLTIKQIKQIKDINALFLVFKAEDKGIEQAMIGKFCIIRTYSAGVHAGTVEAIQDGKVLLRDSYRLWSWKGTGIALSGVANGKLESGNKVDTCNPELYLSEMIECIPCTNEAKESICSQAKK